MRLNLSLKIVLLVKFFYIKLASRGRFFVGNLIPQKTNPSPGDFKSQGIFAKKSGILISGIFLEFCSRDFLRGKMPTPRDLGIGIPKKSHLKANSSWPGRPADNADVGVVLIIMRLTVARLIDRLSGQDS